MSCFRCLTECERLSCGTRINQIQSTNSHLLLPRSFSLELLNRATPSISTAVASYRCLSASDSALNVRNVLMQRAGRLSNRVLHKTPFIAQPSEKVYISKGECKGNRALSAICLTFSDKRHEDQLKLVPCTGVRGLPSVSSENGLSHGKQHTIEATKRSLFRTCHESKSEVKDQYELTPPKLLQRRASVHHPCSRSSELIVQSKFTSCNRSVQLPKSFSLLCALSKHTPHILFDILNMVVVRDIIAVSQVNQELRKFVYSQQKLVTAIKEHRDSIYLTIDIVGKVRLLIIE